MPLNLPLRIRPRSECQGEPSLQAQSPLYDSLPREHFDTLTFQMSKLFTQTFKQASLKGPGPNKTRWNLKGNVKEGVDTQVPSVPVWRCAMLRSCRICVSSSIYHQITELFPVLTKPGSSWRSSSRSAAFKTAHGCPVSFFFYLLMCSFLILAHLSKQRADWPVSVSVQQFPSALFFTILNHS